MNHKTRIVVLRMKEIVYSGIFALLGILFVVLLIIMFFPDKEEEAGKIPVPSVSDAQYIPGVYTTSITLGDQTVDIEVMVDSNNINSIELTNLSEDVETLYPLVEPSFEDLTAQIISNQSLDELTYPDNSKYTSLVLLEAIKLSLDKAKIPEGDSDISSNISTFTSEDETKNTSDSETETTE